MDHQATDPPRALSEAASGTSLEYEMHFAYELLVEDVLAHPLEKLEPINVNPATLLLTVLGAIPRIAPHRGLLARLPLFDLRDYDDLRLYALALAHAHGLRRGATEPPKAVTDLASPLRESRTQLLIDARALAHRGLLDAARVDKLSGGTSHLAMAFDVVGLAGLFLENWSALPGKTATTLQEVERARTLAGQLVLAIGDRRQADDDDPNERIYRQIFSRLTRAYGDVRKALQYLRRREGDANRIAPSAYPGRPKPSTRAGAKPAAAQSVAFDAPADLAALLPEHL